jgi:hypothetical protein
MIKQLEEDVWAKHEKSPKKNSQFFPKKKKKSRTLSLRLSTLRLRLGLTCAVRIRIKAGSPL